MSQPKTGPRCSHRHGARATSACFSDGHGLVALCREHAVKHAQRAGHTILSLEGVRRITALQARALAKAKARRQGILRPEVRAR